MDMELIERAVGWQAYAESAHNASVEMLREGDIVEAVWWQNCAAGDYEAMWSILARLIEVSEG